MPDTAPGPHSLFCLTTWWLEAGCTIYGLSSPTNLGNAESWWQAQTVGNVRADMALYGNYALEGRYASNGIFSYKQLCIGDNAETGSLTS